MVRLIALFVLSFVLSFVSKAQQGYHVQGEVQGFEGDQVFIGYRLGDKTYVRDTLDFKNGVFDFKGEEKVDEGIYLLILPPSMNYLEFLMSEEQTFSFSTKVGEEINAMNFNGSKDNEVYYNYLKFVDSKNHEIEKLEEENTLLPNTTNSYQRNLQEIYRIKNQMVEYRQAMYDNYPNLLITKLFKASEDPKVPENLMDSNVEELTRLYYIRGHFFDNVDFTENAVLKLPLFLNRVNRYYDQFTVQHPDSLIESVETVLDLASVNPFGFKMVMVETVNKYANSDMTAAENVYVHLVENYYEKGKAPWADSATIAKMSIHAKTLKPTLLRSEIPDFDVIDATGKKVSPKKMKEDFTVLLLWNPDKVKQQEYATSLVNMLDGREDDQVELVTIALSGESSDWETLIKNTGLEDFKKSKNCFAKDNFDFFKQTFNYNSEQPRMFLLDEDKIIIAKDLEVNLLEEHLSNILNKND